MPLRRIYREGAADTNRLSLLNVCHQSGTFNSFWSVPPKQDLRKIAYILIELAFSTEIFFFFFKTYIYKYKYLQLLSIFTVVFFFSNIKLHVTCCLANKRSLFLLLIQETEPELTVFINIYENY